MPLLAKRFCLPWTIISFLGRWGEVDGLQFFNESGVPHDSTSLVRMHASPSTRAEVGGPINMMVITWNLGKFAVNEDGIPQMIHHFLDQAQTKERAIAIVSFNFQECQRAWVYHDHDHNDYQQWSFTRIDGGVGAMGFGLQSYLFSRTPVERVRRVKSLRKAVAAADGGKTRGKKVNFFADYHASSAKWTKGTLIGLYVIEQTGEQDNVGTALVIANSHFGEIPEKGRLCKLEDRINNHLGPCVKVAEKYSDNFEYAAVLVGDWNFRMVPVADIANVTVTDASTFKYSGPVLVFDDKSKVQEIYFDEQEIHSSDGTPVDMKSYEGWTTPDGTSVGITSVQAYEEFWCAWAVSGSGGKQPWLQPMVKLREHFDTEKKYQFTCRYEELLHSKGHEAVLANQRAKLADAPPGPLRPPEQDFLSVEAAGSGPWSYFSQVFDIRKGGSKVTRIPSQCDKIFWLRGKFQDPKVIVEHMEPDWFASDHSMLVFSGKLNHNPVNTKSWRFH